MRSADALKPAIADRIAESRRALDEQYAHLFAPLVDKPTADRAIAQ
jgi:hypothetical protein